MTHLLLALSLLVAQEPDPRLLEERIDWYSPSSGAVLGSERTWFGPDGRRLRLETADSTGTTTLSFFVLHDSQGREIGALYIEEGASSPSQETFTYSADGRLKTTTYYYEPGVASERTESDLDETGREVRKRYYRADGSQYGEEDVLWRDDGLSLGWDFRYVKRDGGAAIRYQYETLDGGGEWTRRVRTRNGEVERIEVRSHVMGVTEETMLTPAPFAPGRVSTDRSETSPSFSADGRIMVFARYGHNWTRKEPFIAHLEPEGWRVEPPELGSVYNLAISPDGQKIMHATRTRELRTLYSVQRTDEGWSSPRDMTQALSIRGAYP